MQTAFFFGIGDDLEWMRDRLVPCFGDAGAIRLRSPIGQLVKSMISSRTRDEISTAAYERLKERYPEWPGLADARADDVEAIIGDVTFADVKARYLVGALPIVAASRPGFDLSFLGGLTVPQALAWLERLPGVGRKVAASTLNFSTLTMPAFVVDTHILRILRRYGMIGRKADTRAAFDAVMAMAGAWTATDLAMLHIVMKRLGQTVCRFDRGDCDVCPIRLRCKAAAPILGR